MSRFTEQLRIQTREAALHRLCRVTTHQRGGRPVRIFEVREPTPENLAQVGALVRKPHRRGHQASGTVVAGEA